MTKDRIAIVNRAIAVTAVLRLVVFGKGKEAISAKSCWRAGCGVKLPNSSEPFSIKPLPLRSRASQASSEPAAVQEDVRLRHRGLDRS